MKSRLPALEFLYRSLSVDGDDERHPFLRESIAGEQVDWAQVLPIANDQLISPALWVALRSKGLDSALPTDVRSYLHELYCLNRARNERLKVQVTEIVRILNAAGIAPVLLKGAALLFTDTYSDIGSRVMLDLDILVPRGDAQRCWDLLVESGYLPIDSDHDFSRHHHLTPLGRSGEYATVELHREGVSGEASRFLSTEDVWSQCCRVPGVNPAMFIPNPTARFMYALLHEAVQHGSYYRPAHESLRTLHELAVTSTGYRHEIDWDSVRQSFARNGKSRVLNVWLFLSHSFFSGYVPEQMRASFLALEYYSRRIGRWAVGRRPTHA